MKKSITCVILSAITIWSCSEQPQSKEFSGDFGSGDAQYRNTETKNLSPYSVFGDTSFVLLTEQERTGNHSLIIPSKGNNPKYSKIEIQLRTGLVRAYDRSGRLVEEFVLPPEIPARFLQVDPSAHSYPNISPYAYVANNPLIYIDPTGAYIEPASQKEWEKQTGAVMARRDQLQGKIDKLTAKAEAKGWSAEKLAGKIGNMSERVASLNSTISVFGAMEGSSQGYSLNKNSGEVGGTAYDPKTGNIVISFNSTALFVHESTHAGQFETGDIAFDSKSGNSYVQDVIDEANAYKAQFGYDPSSVATAKSFGAITPEWVQGVTTSIGDKPYAPGGSANTATSPVNINSTKADFIRAYPHIPGMRDLPDNFSIKTTPNAVYKKQ